MARAALSLPVHRAPYPYRWTRDCTCVTILFTNEKMPWTPGMPELGLNKAI